MSKLKLNTADLAVTSFQPAPGTAQAAAAGSIDSIAVALTPILYADTVDQICFCMTWVAEDCFGPTAGCSTDNTA
ncbi:MAG TPA: hypothetical protein VFE05_01270 [Longimicrobiaceae bacterium]|jgi:hypothetical protein|nr:hypothetical protein [Longimicrobiaceae bacterium]